MNEYGLTKNEISKKLYSLLSIDETFTSGKIIGSMCTEPDSYSKYIYSKFLEKNIGDPGLFKGTLLLEKQISIKLENYFSILAVVGLLFPEALKRILWLCGLLETIQNKLILKY